MRTGAVHGELRFTGKGTQVHEGQAAQAGTWLHKEGPGVRLPLSEQGSHAFEHFLVPGALACRSVLLVSMAPSGRRQFIEHIGRAHKPGTQALLHQCASPAQALDQGRLHKMHLPGLAPFHSGHGFQQGLANVQRMSGTVHGHEGEPAGAPFRAGKPQGQGQGQGTGAKIQHKVFALGWRRRQLQA